MGNDTSDFGTKAKPTDILNLGLSEYVKQQ